MAQIFATFMSYALNDTSKLTFERLAKLILDKEFIPTVEEKEELKKAIKKVDGERLEKLLETVN